MQKRNPKEMEKKPNLFMEAKKKSDLLLIRAQSAAVGGAGVRR